MSTPVLPVGPALPDALRAQLEEAVTVGHARGLLTGLVHVLDAGMETVIAPYLVLGVGPHQRLMVLERRNDDGEWDALVYPAPPAPSAGGYDQPGTQRAMAQLGEQAQELGYDELVEHGLTPTEESSWEVGDWLRDTLYSVRAVVSPHALD